LFTSIGSQACGDLFIMAFEFFLALFIMGVGVSFAGSATHLYQGISQQAAYLRFDGESFVASLGHLFMSFICGPFIMMKMGWNARENGSGSIGNLLLGSMVGFGWGFINGLLLLGVYFAIFG